MVDWENDPCELRRRPGVRTVYVSDSPAYWAYFHGWTTREGRMYAVLEGSQGQVREYADLYRLQFWGSE